MLKKLALFALAILFPLEAFAAGGKFQSYSPADITTTTPQELVPARPDFAFEISLFVVGNSHATVGTDVQLLSGSTVIAFCPAAANNGGCVVSTSADPIYSEVGEALNCKAVTTGAAVRCYVKGRFVR